MGASSSSSTGSAAESWCAWWNPSLAGSLQASHRLPATHSPGASTGSAECPAAPLNRSAEIPGASPERSITGAAWGNSGEGVPRVSTATTKASSA